jgi:hypothetical protein
MTFASLRGVLGAAAIVAGLSVLPATANADPCDRTTYFTFGAPVALPGIVLPAGSYQFKHVDCWTTTGLLRVSSRDGRTSYGTFSVLQATRAEATAKPYVVFVERPARVPVAMKAWYYAGEISGDQFIYEKPHADAKAIRKAKHHRLVAQRTK